MKKILLIEDNDEIRENMTEIMELAGYQVYTAKNGKEGVMLAIAEKPDLIICDIMMPVLDGYGVLHMIQKHEDLQQIPFIFLTAKSERTEVRRGMDMGADDYITKPFDGTELLKAIAIRLSKAAQGKGAAPANAVIAPLSSMSWRRKDVLKELLENRSINKYKKKQLIFSEHNHPSYLFYIISGSVKSFIRNAEGKELISGLSKAGDFLGYIPMMEDSTYRESAEAIEETTLAIIPRVDFEYLFANNPGTARNFLSILSHNIEEKEEHLLTLAYYSLRKKIGHTLLMLQDKYQSENEKEGRISVSRENLANIVGVTKESVTRIIGEFKVLGFIDYEGSSIKILNRQALMDIGE